MNAAPGRADGVDVQLNNRAPGIERSQNVSGFVVGASVTELCRNDCMVADIVVHIAGDEIVGMCPDIKWLG